MVAELGNMCGCGFEVCIIPAKNYFQPKFFYFVLIFWTVVLKIVLKLILEQSQFFYSASIGTSFISNCWQGEVWAQ